jgi:RNA polymerase sigma-70 factor, ECF subfamily
MDKEFRQLFETNYNNLCRAAYRIVLEKESAREIVQEVFIELWKKDNWQHIESLKAYLYVAVYNRSLSELKKRKPFLSEEAIASRYVTDHHQMEANELEKIITRGIDSLPDECKKIFLLSREEELTYKEIARLLGLSVKTVERQMGIALKKLRDYLNIHWSG